MHTSSLVALLEALQEAEQFIAGFANDAAQQPAVNQLLAKLHTQINVTLIAIDSLRVQAACGYANRSIENFSKTKLFRIAPDASGNGAGPEVQS